MSIDRYQRHSLIDWFSQEDVKASSFAIVGCGAVGNEVAKNLALLGVGKIDLYDFDTIEIHNLTRSVLFREGDVGQNKATVAANRIRDLEPNIDVCVFEGDFWVNMSLASARSYDCILCCVDNFEARIKLNQICLLTKTNLINTGIDSKFGQIEVFPFASGLQTACYECNLPNSAYERVQQRYSCGWLKKVSFIEKKIPTTIITSSLTGSLASSMALNLMRSNAADDAKRILVDSLTGRSTISTVEQSTTCPACTSTSGNVSFLKAKAIIGDSIQIPNINLEQQFITSEPILVSTRCIECDPLVENENIIFGNTLDYDSSIATCKTCGKDSIEVEIKDSFTLSEILEKYIGYTFPCKFLRMDTDNITTIIELE